MFAALGVKLVVGLGGTTVGEPPARTTPLPAGEGGATAESCITGEGTLESCSGCMNPDGVCDPLTQPGLTRIALAGEQTAVRGAFMMPEGD